MTMARADDESREFLRALLPDDPRVRMRPMFGNVAAFVNDHMFAGVFGDRIFVRLSAEDRATLLGEPGAEAFEPLAGRPMREYAVLPAAWRSDPAAAQEWILRSLEWAAALPPKEKKQKARGK